MRNAPFGLLILAGLPGYAAAQTTQAPATGTTRTTTLTGTSADTGYPVQTAADATRTYLFNDGDAINVRGQPAQDAASIAVDGGLPVVLRAGTDGKGILSLTTYRPLSGVYGYARGIKLNNAANLTINGGTVIDARSEDATPNSASVGIDVTGSRLTLNGDLKITTYTLGFSSGLLSYQGIVVVNGNTDISVSARGTNTNGIYQSGGGASYLGFNGDVKVKAFGLWPSDNVHGIYNDGRNTRLAIAGNLDVNATSSGSTAMGIRNQGVLSVTGNATIVAAGPRTVIGITNSHRNARMYIDGDLSVSVLNGGSYTPFGSPTGISNVYGRGAYMFFGGAGNVSVKATTEALAIHNMGNLSFTNPNKVVTLRTAVSCATCVAYGIRNDDGLLTIAGGLDVAVSNTGTGARYAIWNLPGTLGGKVDANQAGGQLVRIDGDVITGNVVAAGVPLSGITNVKLDTAASYLMGNVLGYVDPDVTDTNVYGAGQINLSFANGARWVPTGGTSIKSDFGTGTLTIGAGSGIDMAGAWGSFAPGAIPAYAFRTLSVDSTVASGAKVALADGSTFSLLSDVRRGIADKIVFGSGISSFSALGTQGIRIAYDPALEDTSWVNAASLRRGVTVTSASPITIVDASAAAGGTASFGAVAGLLGTWSGTYENALVQFSYKPIVSLSADGKRILLSGLVLGGNGTASAAKTFTTTLTGTSADTGYDVQVGSAGLRTYDFVGGDAITTSTGDQFARGVELQGGKTVIETAGIGTGLLSISTRRTTGRSWGDAKGIRVVSGGDLVVNGGTTISAIADGAKNAAVGIWVEGSSATFNGATMIKTSTQGYSQGLWSRQSQVAVNGNLAIDTQGSLGQTYAIWNAGGASNRLAISGDATLTASSTTGSVTVAGIYNQGVGTLLSIGGALSATATSTGGDVAGVRNFGSLAIGGNAVLSATGTYGATGLSNGGTGAILTIGGASTITARGGAGNSGDVKGIDNSGTLTLGNAGVVSTLAAATTCATCTVYGIRNENGAATVAGGLDVRTTTTGSGATYALWNLASAGDSTIAINQAGGRRVAIVGDILAGNTSYRGTTRAATVSARLDTADSVFKGRLVAPVDPNSRDALGFATGATQLTFLNGAQWQPTGSGTVINDFGAGSLVLGASGGIDMAAAWGSFAPGSIPTSQFRNLAISSSASGGASVDLRDGATFTIVSNILGGTADRIAFGSGVSAFSATGTQRIRIAYDPVLQDTRWVNAATLKTGTTVAAASPITIVDASAAAGGTARFANIAGIASQWSGAYENALVQFAYTPTVALGNDGRSIVLTGIAIGAGSHGTATAATVRSASAMQTAAVMSTDAAATSSVSATSLAAASAAIRPSDAVLTAQDATQAAVASWRFGGMTALHDLDEYRLDTNAPAVVSSFGRTAGSVQGIAGYDRGFRQSFNQVGSRSDRRTDYDGFRNYFGMSLKQTVGRNDLATGNGATAETSADVHSVWIADSGTFVSMVARVTGMSLDYSSLNTLGNGARGRTSIAASDMAVAAGSTFGVSGGLYVAPDVTLGYGLLSVRGFTDTNQVRIQSDRLATGSATAGLTLGYRAGRAAVGTRNVYTRVALVQPFGGSLALIASKDGGSIAPDAARQGLSVDYSAGGRLRLRDRLNLSLEGARTTGIALASAYNVRAGVNFTW